MKSIKKVIILLTPLWIVLACLFTCIILILIGNIKQNINIKDKRAEVNKYCNDFELSEDIRKIICEDLNKEGGVNGKNYGESSIDDGWYDYNSIIPIKKFKNNDLIILSKSLYFGWNSSPYTEFYVQYKGKYLDKYSFAHIFTPNTKFITSENEDFIWFNILDNYNYDNEKTTYYPLYFIFEVNKKDNKLAYYDIDPLIKKSGDKPIENLDLNINNREIYLEYKDKVIKEVISSKSYPVKVFPWAMDCKDYIDTDTQYKDMSEKLLPHEAERYVVYSFCIIPGKNYVFKSIKEARNYPDTLIGSYSFGTYDPNTQSFDVSDFQDLGGAPINVVKQMMARMPKGETLYWKPKQIREDEYPDNKELPEIKELCKSLQLNCIFKE